VRDMNGNGVDELAVGAIGTQNELAPQVDSPGEVYFIDPAISLTSPIINVLTEGVPGDGFGASLLEVGDITGGTGSELAVGAMRFEVAFEVAAGQTIRPQTNGALTLYELDSFQPLWKVTQLGDAPVESSSMGLGDVDADGSTDLLVLSGWSDRQLPKVRALKLIDGTPSWSFDAAGAGLSQGHAFVVSPDANGDGRDELVLGLPALEDRGALLTYRIDPNPPGPSAPKIWRVDDDGSADFVGLSQAALVARSGDRVQVAPGEYANAWIARELIITGPDDLEFTAGFPWLEVKGAVRTHLEALTVGLTALGDLFGRATLDRITTTRAVVVDAEDAVIAHSTIGPGRMGIDLRDSYLQVRSSRVEGSTSTFSDLPPMPAVEMAFDAELLAVESVFIGGDDLTATLPDVTLPAPGIRVGNGCRLDLRGTAAASVNGGTDPSDPLQDALGLDLDASAVAFASASHAPVFKSGPGWLTTDERIRPWLDYESSVAVGPGASWKVTAHAEAGTLVAFFLGLQSANFELPTLVVGTPILVNTASQLASAVLVGKGLGAPPAESFPIPDNPALIGLQLHLQGFALRSDGAYDGTNGGALLLRD
ncbi:MAG: hypothetical protein AAFZ65_16945, partial [Planctomycetota bacterium]